MDIAGVYIRISPGDSAEIQISRTRLSSDRYHVSGLALWGEKRPGGPNLGELDFSANLERSVIEHEDNAGMDTYRIRMKFDGPRMVVTEENAHGTFGMNVHFEGEYRRGRSAPAIIRRLSRFFRRFADR